MPSHQTVYYRRKTDSGRTTYKQRERIIQRSLTKYLNSLSVDFYNDWGAGAFLTAGQNSSRMALASRGGWVDLFIAEPRQDAHGLFLELKREGEKVYRKDGTLRKKDQLIKENEFLERQRRKGYVAEFAVGIEEARSLIDNYLGLPQQELFDF